MSLSIHDNSTTEMTLPVHEHKHGTAWIWYVCLFLSVITAIEIAIAFIDMSAALLRNLYIIFTLMKAYGIVAYYMHLRDESLPLRLIIVAPYSLFVIYLLYICITEANYAFWIRTQLEAIF